MHMWPAFEAALIVMGLCLWAWAIKKYLDDPGYGGFDMNTAPAFDFRWVRGTLFVSLGAGLLTDSWLIGVVGFVASTAATLLVKPVLGGYARRLIARAAGDAGSEQPAAGFKALSQIENDLRS